MSTVRGNAFWHQQPFHCPHCGVTLHGSSVISTGGAPVEGVKAPKDGDFSLCVECGALSVFDGGGTRLRMPTPAEQVEGEDHLAATRETYRRLN